MEHDSADEGGTQDQTTFHHVGGQSQLSNFAQNSPKKEILRESRSGIRAKNMTRPEIENLNLKALERNANFSQI